MVMVRAHFINNHNGKGLFYFPFEKKKSWTNKNGRGVKKNHKNQNKGD